MGPEFLTDSMSVYIEREINVCISFESIIDDFTSFGKLKCHFKYLMIDFVYYVV